MVRLARMPGILGTGKYGPDILMNRGYANKVKQFVCACLFLCLLCPNPQQAAENTAAYAAGIIIYADTPTGIGLLLADHAPPSQRGWAAFGGRHEAGESNAETAARETEEETRGFFKRQMLLDAIGNQQPVYDSDFPFYFVKVEYVPAAEIERHWFPPWRFTYRERGPYAWIPYSQLARYLDADTASHPVHIDPAHLPENRHTDWLWTAWLSNLRVAANTRALPWEGCRSKVPQIRVSSRFCLNTEPQSKSL